MAREWGRVAGDVQGAEGLDVDYTPAREAAVVVSAPSPPAPFNREDLERAPGRQS